MTEAPPVKKIFLKMGVLIIGLIGIAAISHLYRNSPSKAKAVFSEARTSTQESGVSVQGVEPRAA